MSATTAAPFAGFVAPTALQRQGFRVRLRIAAQSQKFNTKYAKNSDFATTGRSQLVSSEGFSIIVRGGAVAR